MEGVLLTRTPAGGGGSGSSNCSGGGLGGGFGGVMSIGSIGMGSRSSSASSAERSLLLGALATHMGVLDARENDAQTIIRKSELWDEITRQFNAQTLAPRSRQQIQTLYKNMKAKARRYEARLAEVASGVPPPDPDPISEMLLGLLHQQMQHQRRHLQRLAVLDNYSHAQTPPTHTPPTDDTMKSFSTHVDTPLLTPDQVMQMSLEEGIAPEMEVKNEPQDKTLPASPERHLQKREEEEAEEGEGEESSSSDIFSDTFFIPRPSSGVPTSLPQPQGVAVTAAVGAISQEQQQEGKQRLPLSFTSTCQNAIPQPRAQSAGVPCSTSYQTPSPKVSLALPFQSSASPYAPPFTRSPQGANISADHLYLTAKRPRLDALGDVGRAKGCGSSPASRAFNVHCCCPDMHASLADQAEQEHHLRMKALKEESEARAEEHAARMRILCLEEELLRVRLEEVVGRRCEGDLNNEKDAEASDESGDAGRGDGDV